jgi:NAD(P)-dependent dehydrogenase (short-subunit alcohol dehydrogenase family)
MTQQLQNKNAIIYGGSGSIGGASARAFAREGATVFLAGRTLKTLQVVAEDIKAAGGSAHVAELDALDESAVNEHAAAVAVHSAGYVLDSGRASRRGQDCLIRLRVGRDRRGTAEGALRSPSGPAGWSGR